MVDSPERLANMKKRLEAISNRDSALVYEKDIQYGHSWRKRGGVGAFHVIARKWDRIEERLTRKSEPVLHYDLFEHIRLDKRPEGIIDDIRDLRCYLLLVEEEMMSRGWVHDILPRKHKKKD